MANILSDSDYAAVLDNDNVPIHAQMMYFKLMVHGLWGFDKQQRRDFGNSPVAMKWLIKRGAIIVRSDREDSPHKEWFEQFNKYC